MCESTITLSKLLKAYYDCRKHKRGTLNALNFEFNLEENLYSLYSDLISNNYKIGRNICFVVEYPKPREIWAADFRDRVVHHLVYNEIKDIFYNRFIKDTYSCIPSRGTGNAVKCVRNYASSITDNYKRESYYLKADIKNFFVSIDKDILYKEVSKYVTEGWLLSLLQQIIFHNPKSDVHIRCSREKFKILPKYKSLWYTSESKGLPIGNLTSQFFSNVYLNVLDQYVKHKLKCKYYCRYVDDFVIMDDNPRYLAQIHSELTEFLKSRLSLELHQNKKLINKVSKGIDFVGYVIKPNHIILRQRTLKRIFNIIKKYKANKEWYLEEQKRKYINTINSYLGMLRQSNGYNLRRKICIESINLFISCDEEFTKLIII